MVYTEIFLSIILGILAFLLGILRDNNKQIYNKKLEIYSNIVFEINNLNYARSVNQAETVTGLVKLFAPARLIGSNKIVKELREYFSSVIEFYKSSDKKEKDKIMDRISVCTMELEQLMRVDLGKNRDLSKLELFLHHYTKHKN